MNVRELMIEVDREIEVARQTGAWEFDHRAAMEEVEEALRLYKLEEEGVVVWEDDEPVASEEAVEPEAPTADDIKSDEVEVPGNRDKAERKSESTIMEELMKGRRKEGFERTRLIYERILSQRPTTLKECAQIAREVYAADGLKWVSRNILVSTLKDKFTKLGLIEWDGQAKSEIVWL